MAKGKDKSREWFERALSGEQFAPDALKQLPLDSPKESLYLDYKSGQELDDPKKAARTLREYVSAFANADGGLVVLGYDETPKLWDGARPPGTGTPCEWARSVLDKIPQTMPRISTAKADGQDVLLVAVARCRTLVPVVEDGAATYYLRMADSTLPVPPYLVSDLMLGRRNHALLEATDAEYTHTRAVAQQRDLPEFRFAFTLDNAGLSFAEDVQVGMVSWIVAPRSHFFAVNAFLRQQIDAEEPPTDILNPGWRLAHQPRPREGRIDLGPFEQRERISLGPCYWPTAQSDTTHRLRRCDVEAALYAVAKNEEPWWFQLTVTYDAGTPELNMVGIAPLRHERPRVSITLKF